MPGHRSDLLCSAAMLGKPSQSCFAQTVRLTPRRQAGELCSSLDQLREPSERPSPCIGEEVLHPDYRTGLECSGQSRMDRDHQLVCGALTRLVLGHADATIDNVIAHHPRNVGAALCRIKQKRNGPALTSAERPSSSYCESSASLQVWCVPRR